MGTRKIGTYIPLPEEERELTLVEKALIKEYAKIIAEALLWPYNHPEEEQDKNTTK